MKLGGMNHPLAASHGDRGLASRTPSAADGRHSYSNGAILTAPFSDHEKLDLFRLSIDCVAASHGAAGRRHHAGTQPNRRGASKAIPATFPSANPKKQECNCCSLESQRTFSQPLPPGDEPHSIGSPPNAGISELAFQCWHFESCNLPAFDW
jgi:hypothetical protein